MAGYTRNDTANNIADGNIINASDLDGEFDAVQSAFNASTGHTHDGTSGEGAPIEKVGPVQDLVITASEVKPKTTDTLDLGTNLLQFKNLYIEGSAYIDGLGETMLVAGSSSIQFRDTALAINSSTDGQLDIIADTQLEITAPTVEFNTDGQILAFGADGEVTLTHVADTGVLLNTNAQLQFRDSALKINSSADGQLDIDADTELELTAPTVDINASTSVNISNDLKLDSDSAILSLGADSEVTLTHLHNVGTELKVVNSTTSSVTDILDLQVESSGTPAVGIGTGLTFSVETAGGNVETAGAIRAVATGLTPTDEELDLVFYSMRNGSLTEAFRFDSINDSLSLADNVKATFGTDDDLQIYHDGSKSIIHDNGAGQLLVRTNQFNVNSADNTEKLLEAIQNAQVDLYYNNSKKLATTNTGIDVTGTVTADENITIDTSSSGNGLTIQSSGNTYNRLTFDANRSASGNLLGEIMGEWNGTQVAAIRVSAGSDTVNKDDGQIYFLTNPDGTGNKNRVNIANNGDISFYDTAGSSQSLFWDATNERLGIGTTSPSTPLQVNGSSGQIIYGQADAGDAAVRIDTSNAGSIAYFWARATNTGQSRLQFGDPDDADVGWIDYDHSDNSLAFRVNASERMRIDSSGNVGIGCTPGEKLEVAGAIEAGDQANGTNGQITIRSRESADFTRTSIGALYSSGNAYYGRAVEPSTSVTNGFNGGITNNTGGGAWVIGNTGETYFTSTGGSVAMTKGSALTMYERVRIDSSGNFIFNENSNDSDFRVESNDVSNALYVDGADNYIAIHGNSTTLSQLYLKNFAYGSTDSSGEAKIEFGWSNHSGAAIAGYKAATNRTGLKFYSEFGYNTPSLMAAWDRANGTNFNPDQNDQNFNIASVNNANMLFVDAANDQVAIGHTAPSCKLDIRDSVSASTSLEPVLLELHNISDGGVAMFFRNGVDGNSKISSKVNSTGSGTDETSLIFSTSNGGSLSEAARFNSIGNLAFPNGQGIDFSASAGGGASSSLLDDYEEGTFTPTVTYDDGSATSTGNDGHYVKVGNLVTCWGRVNVTSRNSNTGNTRIANLPFTVGNVISNTALDGFGGLNYWNSLDTAVSNITLGATESTTHAQLFYVGGSGVSSNNTSATVLGDVWDARFWVTYII